MLSAAISSGRLNRASDLTARLAEKDAISRLPEKPLSPLPLDKVSGKIAVDIDDTLGNFEADMRRGLAILEGISYEEALKKYPVNPPGGIDSWVGGNKEAGYQLFLKVEKAGLLYHHQTPRAHAAETLNWLYRKTGGKLFFLTARDEKFNNISRKWLQKRLGVDFPVEIQNSRAKEQVEDFDVLIDDSDVHANAVASEESPHGPRDVIWLTKLHNDDKVPENDKIHRARNWKEIQKILKIVSQKQGAENHD